MVIKTAFISCVLLACLFMFHFGTILAEETGNNNSKEIIIVVPPTIKPPATTTTSTAPTHRRLTMTMDERLDLISDEINDQYKAEEIKAKAEAKEKEEKRQEEEGNDQPETSGDDLFGCDAKPNPLVNAAFVIVALIGIFLTCTTIFIRNFGGCFGNCCWKLSLLKPIGDGSGRALNGEPLGVPADVKKAKLNGASQGIYVVRYPANPAFEKQALK